MFLTINLVRAMVPPGLRVYNSTKNEIAALLESNCDLFPRVSPSLEMQCKKGSEKKQVELAALHTMKQKCVDGYIETKFQQAIRVIRKLELDRRGNLRTEFVTWLSIPASAKHEAQIGVLIDTFSDDPPTLANQLVDTFSEEIRTQKLWLALN